MHPPEVDNIQRPSPTFKNMKEEICQQKSSSVIISEKKK
jgi:hypothetical protein